MNEVLLFTLISVTIVSCLSLLGAITLSFNQKKLNSLLIYFVSFSAGALLGDVFIHLLPELIENGQFSINTSLLILAGILISFILEKFICWHHCKMSSTSNHVHRLAYMNLFGDAFHNFMDGIVIATSFLVSIPVGIATTIAIILHEIPQEIGDFGVLLHAGLAKKKALLYNFFSGIAAIAGSIFALTLHSQSSQIIQVLLPITIGSFIYIAASDLIPELHKEENTRKNVLQTLIFIAGIGIMMLLIFLE